MQLLAVCTYLHIKPTRARAQLLAARGLIMLHPIVLTVAGATRVYGPVKKTT